MIIKFITFLYIHKYILRKSTKARKFYYQSRLNIIY
uniref:Uncharacterized protein n=1 Tax=Laurencia australis TaxID=3073067 RepID=A0AA51NEH7_9FLOR|nr:hypothetical protein [Laurencia australis]WMP12056.1 hypothetical protein [Laurencia australis]